MDRHTLADINAEKAVIGCILVDPAAMDRVFLGVDDFASERHRHIYGAMRKLSDKSTPPDLVAVSSALRGQVSASYLNDLCTDGWLPTHIPHYCASIRKFATARKLINACREIQDAIEDDNALDLAESKIMEIREGGGAEQTAIRVKDLLGPVLAEIEQHYNNKSAITGITTGYTELDRMTSGLQPGDLVILAGRPSMGKTALAVNILENAAIKGFKGLGFSLEMGDKSLIKRMLGSIGRVDGQRLRTGQLIESDWPKLIQASETMASMPIWIDDTARLGVMELRAKARRHKRQHGLDLIVIDYLQLMKTPKADRHDLAVGDITRSLKGLAKELNVPIICLSQLSRDLEKRTDKRPTMADLRESGAIEQDADLILFPYREAVYCDKCKAGNCDILHHERRAELIVAKQRNGPTGAIKLVWLPEFSRYGNLEEIRGVA
jgi:replicative DNA helicase